MKTKRISEETVWTKYECGGGARWTSARRWLDERAGEICNFSGCGCNTPIRIAGRTSNRGEASAWFRRP